MKVVHLSPNAPYNDDWGYQENLLPKYQKKLGCDVTLIVTNLTHRDGQAVEVDCADYVLNDGVRVIRLARKKFFSRAATVLNSHLNVLPYLKEIQPDLIFFHGLCSTTIFEAIEYKKRVNPNCVIVQDNHLDYNIGLNAVGLKRKLMRAYYRRVNRKSIPYVERVYGVTPWRKKYAEDYYRIPTDKTDVLIMGADDEKIDFANRAKIREEIRTRLGVADDEFLIATGGKIDRRKKIHLLMDAARKKRGVKLLVFGRVLDDVKDEFERLVEESDNIVNVGWIDADKVYDYYFASDLVFFPGQHSVLWEQACAAKVPCVFEKWEGMEHVDVGGNADFIENISVEKIVAKIEELRFTEKYRRMQAVAASEKTDVYLYGKIAEASLACAKK